MEEDMEVPSVQAPVVPSGEKPVAKLRQLTIHADDEIEEVNKLLGDGWRIVSIGFRPDATVFVLGQTEEKKRPRTGFGFKRED